MRDSLLAVRGDSFGVWWVGHEVYLTKHLIVLHLIHLLGTDLSLQCVFVELAADVHEQGGRAGIHVATQGDVVDVSRHMNAIP